MFRTRLFVFLAATILVTACSASVTSPTSPRRYAPRSLHDGQPGDTTDTTGRRGNINPNG
jgi:hypothetical protein